MPYYTDADLLCPVPRSTISSEASLPERLCDLVSTSTGILNLNGKVRWVKKDCHLQDVALNQRWKSLELSGFEIDDSKTVDGKVIILIDDLYQSGNTMHFLAKQLIDCGARAVLGLAVVKAVSDGDNILKGK